MRYIAHVNLPPQMFVQLEPQDMYGTALVKSTPALVDNLYFSESLAAAIGASPPLLESLLMGNLWRFFRLLLVSLNGAHYRFRGPNANPQAADRVLQETLFYPWLEILRPRIIIRPLIGAMLIHIVSAIMFPLNPNRFRAVGATMQHVQRFLVLLIWGVVLYLVVIHILF